MKYSALFGFMLGIAMLVILATYFGYTHFYQTDVQELPIHVRVDNFLGMHTGTDALWFGTISPGSSSKRYLNITNPKEYTVTVEFTIDGKVAPWITISDNSFDLEPDKSRKVSVFANVPDTASFGNYTGTLYSSFRRG